MSDYRLQGVESAAFSEDRREIAINFNTDRGGLVVRLSADHLEQLFAVLGHIESAASVHDPSAGPARGEAVSRRVNNADAVAVEIATVDGAQKHILGMESEQLHRWHTLPATRAPRLQKAIEGAISNLGKGGPSVQ